ncbi:MAG: sulfatase [Planctomycetaceae bacterium]
MNLTRWFLVVVALLPGWTSVTMAADKPNVLLLCIDDLRPELNCFGVTHISSPNIDALAAKGRIFQRHYVQAPTCGASRYALLTGRYGPSGNGAIFARADRLKKNPDTVAPSMPAWFRQHGYMTVSVGKVSHHPGGRGGADWDDEAIPEMPNSWDRHLMPTGDWQHPRGAMHGLAHGEIRGNAKAMDVLQAVAGPDSIYPDGLTVDEALKQLGELSENRNSNHQPFFLAVGVIRPHLPFGAPKKYRDLYDDVEFPPIPHPEKPSGTTTWHSSGEFMKYNRWDKNPNTDAEFATEVRKAYAACVSYADAQVGKLLSRLDELGQRSNTVVILWGDHGWHLGEHAIWGKHALFEESLRSPLIVHYDGIVHPGKATSAVVETIDIFPTLCELTDVPSPEFAHGKSLIGQCNDPAASGHSALSYASAQTIRTATHRLILHPKGQVELYDHESSDGETHNIAAEHPDLVDQLTQQLNDRANLRD